MPAKIMLDSGAFSAWTRNKIINLDEYISFIKRFEDDLESYVNLDVIPGRPGSQPTPKEVDFSANEGWNNYLKMIEEGLNPIPVFHFGEDTKWLEKMIDSGAEYIGLGGMVKRPLPILKKWLDMVFSMITDSKGYPIAQVHGFGLTSAWALCKYPWYSVDSVSWKLWAAYGACTVPKYNLRQEKFTYQEPPFVIFTSELSSKKYQLEKHSLTINSTTKKVLEKYLEEIPVKLEDLELANSKARQICNAIYYDNLGKFTCCAQFKSKRKTFFKKRKFLSSSIQSESSTIVYLGIGSTKEIEFLSQAIENPQVLISYMTCSSSVDDNHFKKYKEAAIKEKISE